MFVEPDLRPLSWYEFSKVSALLAQILKSKMFVETALRPVSWCKFSKVSALVYVLYKASIEL
jgi:hypothetical protein